MQITNSKIPGHARQQTRGVLSETALISLLCVRDWEHENTYNRTSKQKQIVQKTNSNALFRSNDETNLL